MGLSVSVSFAILTVGFFIGAAAMVDAALYSLDRLMQGAEEIAEERMEWARTRFVLNNATLNGSTVVLNLTNTGSTVLEVAGISVLVNGTYVNRSLTSATVGGRETSIWTSAELLRLELNITASASERVVVITGNGVTQYGVIL
ncbi:MAG: hypothetical protein QXH42_01465 [Thermoplasmata archaeon]